MAGLAAEMNTMAIALTKQSTEDEIVKAVTASAHSVAKAVVGLRHSVTSLCAEVVNSEKLRLDMIKFTSGRTEEKLVNISTAASDQKRWVKMNGLIDPQFPGFSSYRCVGVVRVFFQTVNPLFEVRVTIRSSSPSQA